MVKRIKEDEIKVKEVVRILETIEGQVIVGFAIADLLHLLPLTTVLDSGVTVSTKCHRVGHTRHVVELTSGNVCIFENSTKRPCVI